ncbi:MAG: hypothetical protein ACI8XO_002105 [Verrucomicrobiales bacterium]|jgi:uncharacterized protein (DUF58 family)
MLRRDSGDSTEFHDHRNYTPGDDPRRINWAAYARTGQLSMKLYRQEGRPLIDCLLDFSPSMWQPLEKAERVIELLYFVIESAAAQQAGLRLWAIAGSQMLPLANESFYAGVDWVKQLPPPPDDALPISTSNVPLRSGSRRILISDLLFAVEPDDLIRPLTARNGSATILAPWHPEEEDPEWGGVCQLDDSETQTMREVEFDPASTKAYREAYSRHFENWQRSSRSHAAGFSRIRSGGTLAAALGAELATINPSATA